MNIAEEMARMVREFMTTFDQEIYPTVQQIPCETALFRSALITEEAKEYSRAPFKSEEELDAICDLLYVVIGTNVTMSVPVKMNDTWSGLKPLVAKPDIWNFVLAVTQDLDSRFPCANIQFKELNRLINFLLGIGSRCGYRTLEAFKEVHRANMNKLWQHPPELVDGMTAVPKGKLWLVKRKDGKVVKPKDWTAPNLEKFL